MKTVSGVGGVGPRRGAVATVTVLAVAAVMIALVVIGADVVRRSRRSVKALDDQQARHWARAEKGGAR